jgi:predicted  nucleic acid-binding Zn-ribbon protein
MRKHGNDNGVMLWALADLLLISGIFLLSQTNTLSRNLDAKSEDLQKLESVIYDLTGKNQKLDEEIKSKSMELKSAEESRKLLTALLVAKEKELQALPSTITKLEQSKVERIKLAMELERLQKELTIQGNQLATLTTERDNLANRLKAAEKDRDNLALSLKTEREEWATRVATIQKKYDNLNDRYATLKKEYQVLQSDLEVKGDLAKKVMELSEKLAGLQTEKKAVDARLVKGDDEKKSLADEVARLNGLLVQAKKGRDEADDARRTAEGRLGETERKVIELKGLLSTTSAVPQELLGLKTRKGNDGKPVPLARIAVLIDTSVSMSTNDPLLGNRWVFTKKLITTWVTHLAVKEAVVIEFNSTAHKLRPNPYNMTNQVEKDNLLLEINKLSPTGTTATLAALKLAYEEHTKKPLDAILLFTDGAPTEPDKKTEPIYDLCKGQGVPINAIGVGDYFTDPALARFLIHLAEITEGSFQGR